MPGKRLSQARRRLHDSQNGYFVFYCNDPSEPDVVRS